MSKHRVISNADVNSSIDFLKTRFGLDLRADGTFASEPTAEQIEVLRDWQVATTVSGIIIPDIDTFISKSILAKALMPQVGSGKTIQYLFGKGHGLELAIQGQVVGRQKRLGENTFRTHSDFELYGCSFSREDNPSDKYSALEQSDRFRAVFGSMEIFPVDGTKGLHGLPPTLLHDTSELVSLGSVYFLVPQLELQFVDKFIKSNLPVEESFRGMSDAQALAMAYELDRNIIHDAIDDYVVRIVFEAFVDPEVVAQKTQDILVRKVETAKQGLLEDNPGLAGSELAQAIASDVVVKQYCKKRSIDPSRIIDSETGLVSSDIKVYLAEAETQRQADAIAEVHDMHKAVDEMLDRVELNFAPVTPETSISYFQ